MSSKIFLLVIQKSKLEADYNYSEDRVVVDGNLVTSRGPGTCFEFAFKLAELLVDNDMYDQLKAQTLALTAWNWWLMKILFQEWYKLERKGAKMKKCLSETLKNNL